MNYENDLKGVPQEIIDKIVERQVEQGNKADAGVFDKRFYSDKKTGGFNWGDSTEGFNFWQSIEQKNYKYFYALYPKERKVFELKQPNAKTLLDEHLFLLIKDKCISEDDAREVVSEIVKYFNVQKIG